ncbi:UDP-glucosyltransferase 2-like isoform X2 [Homalodisca vitripennis]|nr:UDP-glucosyltransferase 2-like isoform X2 [Homalodisca vitripennis]XP_046661746.1 UDP-glucosyltransferase 2-like isoform X2 [Homalodisca vitripennis]XP_046661747.1 UDP-glucosyltransferase 2-like isoform X2 [Homalodisca vitripennis]XP_046661748.1 UDP-glucosyltransferase 2-like isoform X2 [Homalodisca vitripennis]
MYIGVILLPLFTVCDGARILALVPFPSKSHWIVIEPLFQELAARGHQVTVFSSFPQKKPLPNYTDVDCSGSVPPGVSGFSIERIRQTMPSPWETIHFIREYNEESCKILGEPKLQNVLKSKERYDLLITELFASDCFTYVAYKLKIPLISYTTSTAMPWGADRVGYPDNPSYITNLFVGFSPEMTLWQRIYNTAVLVYTKFWHLCVYAKWTQNSVEKIFSEALPPLHEVVGNTSLVFVNSYHALAQSRPFPPGVIEIGGIHIKESQPLMKDMQQILDNSKKGVIIMSFGSLVRTSALQKPIIQMFMNVFSEISQTVIMKYEESLPQAPPNVILREWLPQRDLIEHENVVAVIGHGGLSSLTETVYVGKPMIGIPFFADQYVNIANIVRRGAGIQLDYDDLSEEKIRIAVDEILNNPKYKDNMRRLSQQFRDRPMTPLQTAVYWTEYVIRHQGAPHLRPASVNMPLYQYLLLDVIFVLTALLAFVLLAFYWLIRLTFYSIKLVISNKTVNLEKCK